MALFQYWNFNRFHNPFSIYRDNIMQLSKIGSKNTYHKCIKELHEAKYIYYHPSVNKFHLVRISIIPLDVQTEQPSRYKQLDLFGIDNDTGSVPKEVPASTDNDTAPVPKSVHIIKPNSTKQKTVCNTPRDFLKENGRNEEGNNTTRRVPKSVHDKNIPSPEGLGVDIPEMKEVEEFFTKHNYPSDEAKKFFLYNQGKNWMLTDKLKIKDWHALAHKWMLNIKKSNGGNQTAIASPAKQSADSELNYLYDSFLEGKKIFQHITTQHFEQLTLLLDEETMQQAKQQRIKDIEGSNQYSIGQIWQAYLTNNPNNPLVQKDLPNVMELAKRIAVIKHFQSQKNQTNEH